MRVGEVDGGVVDDLVGTQSFDKIPLAVVTTCAPSAFAIWIATWPTPRAQFWCRRRYADGDCP